MKIIFSPTKTQKIVASINFKKTKPFFIKDSLYILNILQSKSKKELGNILNTSKKILDEVFKIYKDFDITDKKGFAIESFKGTSFKRLDLVNYSKKELDFLNMHVRIMSGLYGILKPFDIIQKYRLDYGDNIFKKNEDYKNISLFWDTKIKKYFEDDDIILNLASNEYSKGVINNFPDKIISVHFLTMKNGKLKTIAMSVKKQRGKILDYIIKNNIENFLLLKKYKDDGYVFNEKKSNIQNYYFIKPEK